MEPDSASAHVTDESLMVQLMNGDREALSALFGRYGDRVRSFVYRFVGNREVAEDITQDIFLKVYRNPRAFDPRGRFTTWIFAIARNASIDHLRLKKLPVIPVSASKEDDWALEPSAPVSISPDQQALHRELEDRMHVVLAGLSDKLREVFVLCALQGLSYEEAAEVMGCPVKTVSSRLSRARDHFFQAFHRHMGDDPVRRNRKQ